MTQLLAHNRCNNVNIPDKTSKLFGIEALGAVGKGFFGFMVYLDHQAVCTGRHRCPCHGTDLLSDTGGMAGINDYRQVGELFQDRNSGKIQSIAGIGFKGTDTPLAQDNVFVAFGRYILGGHEPLLNGGGKTPLEYHRFSHAACTFEQFKVLHVPGTDLNHIHIFNHEIRMHGRCDFGDNS